MLRNRRLKLHNMLCEILGDDKKIFYQPPSGHKVTSKSIIYKFDDVKPLDADNVKYNKKYKFQITLFDKSPVSDYFDKILDLPYCSFSKEFKANHLNHFVFYIFI